MAFWMALVYRGARTRGLREAHSCALEQGVPYFPDDWPDTSAGVCDAKKTEEEAEAKYSRYPPAKRPNYSKLGAQSPFSASWDKLVGDWSPRGAPNGSADPLPGPTNDNSQDPIAAAESQTEQTSVEREKCFYVLRSKSKLDILKGIVVARRRNRQNAKKGTKKQQKRSSGESTNTPMPTLVKEDGRSLVCVSLRMLNRSTPLPNAMLAIPSREDLDEVLKCASFAGPVEPLHKGSKAQLAASLVQEKTLSGSCSREMIGFVTSGHFSLAIGCGFAVGYCALPGLVKLLSIDSRTEGVLVLVRNTTTQQYRFACLDIV